MATKKRVTIIDGPGALAIEHSLFDQEKNNHERKHLRFETEELGMIPDLVIVAGIRKDAHDPSGEDWILWVTNGGYKAIFEYSTRTRKGQGASVDEFPNYGIK